MLSSVSSSKHIQSNPVDNSEHSINEIVNVYENKFKVFTSLNYSPDEIFGKISSIMMMEVNVDMESLFRNDYHSFLMVLCAFYGRRDALNFENTSASPLEEEEDFLLDCHHPLHTLILMCFATHYMQKIVSKEDFGQNLRMEKYENLNKELEDLACKVINHVYLKSITGPQTAKQALQVDYKCGKGEMTGEKGYDKYLNRKFTSSKEIMAIAFKAKAMKFLSQRPCLNLMRIRNICRKNPSEDCYSHSMKGSRLYQMPKKKEWRLKMREKLMLHSFFRLAYVFIFAYKLCRYPVYDDFLLKPIQFLPTVYVSLVLITQFSMSCIKASDYVSFHFKKCTGEIKKKKKYPRLSLLFQYFQTNRLAFYRGMLIILLVYLEAIRFLFFFAQRRNKNTTDEHFWYSFWTVVPILLELTYCVLFAIAVVSSLRLLHFVPSLGFFVHLFKKMWKTVGMFILIFATFWFVLAVIHVSLSRTLTYSKNTMIHTIISEGKFEIFGEVNDDDRIGNLFDCDHFNRTVVDFLDMHYAEASCLFRSSIKPFLVFGYMFITGILLINLLTAQLTKEYEKESENSQYYKGYLRYEQLSKIESKLFLPPPLSLIYVFLRFISYYSNWLLVNVVEKMEGYPWGSVRNFTCNAEVDNEIKEFLNRSQEEVFMELKDLISKYNRDRVDGKKLIDLKEKLNSILDLAVIEDTRATHARSRAQTRAEMEDPAVEIPLRYKVFSSLEISCDLIFEKINYEFMRNIDVNIETLFHYDHNSFLLILAAFFGSKFSLDIPPIKEIDSKLIEKKFEEVKMLHECESPLHTLLLMCFAARTMLKFFRNDEVGQPMKVEHYSRLKNDLEDIACDLINNLYSDDQDGPAKAMAALEIDYLSRYDIEKKKDKKKWSYCEYLNQKFTKSKEIMAIAYRAKARVFRILFIAMFTFMLCWFPVYDDYYSLKMVELIPFYYVLSVLMAQLFVTFFKTIDHVVFHYYQNIKYSQPSFPQLIRILGKYFRSNQLSLFRIVMITPLLILEAFRFFCFAWVITPELKDVNFWYSGWTAVPILIEFIYCVLFSVVVISSLRFLHFVPALGFFVHLFKKMYKTVGMFVMIFITFWFVLAVIHVSLTRTVSHSNNTLLHTITSPGRFEIFGEVDDSDRNGELWNCSQYQRTILDWSDMNYAEASCLFRSSVVPFLVFVYMFVAGILLVNLLTAQLTKEYETESENSQFYKGYLKYGQLSKIESRMFLPPPFSLLFVTIRCFFFFCSSSILTMLVREMEGYPWGSVRDINGLSNLNKHVKSSIRGFLQIENQTIWIELKHLIQQFEIERLTSETVWNAREQINKHLEAVMDQLRPNTVLNMRTESPNEQNPENESRQTVECIRQQMEDPAADVPIERFLR